MITRTKTIASLLLCLPLVCAAAPGKTLIGNYTPFGIEVEAARGDGNLRISELKNGKLQIHGVVSLRNDPPGYSSKLEIKNAVLDPLLTEQIIPCTFKFVDAGPELKCKNQGKTASLEINEEGEIVIICQSDKADCDPMQFSRFRLWKKPAVRLTSPRNSTR